MRSIKILAFLTCLASARFASAEDWKEFKSLPDMFTANFPGDPVITDALWTSDYGAVVPARVYTAKSGPSTYKVMVVDYNLVKQMDIEKAKRCPGYNLERCTGDTSYSGEGYWRNDVRGAMIYAEFKILQRDVKLTNFAWNYLGQGIEANEMQLVNNADKSRTFVSIYMHLNRLYIAEATAPANYPAPSLFIESIVLLNEEGFRARHEGVYFNAARVDPFEKNTKLTGILERPTAPQRDSGKKPASGEWREFKSVPDMFVANVPGDPAMTEVPWTSEYGAVVPSHVYTVKSGPSTYTLTVVDYNLVKQIDIDKAKKCPAYNLERCTGDTSYSGEGYWRNDVRGAMIFAEYKILQRGAKLTNFAWNYLGQGIEANEMQLVNNADKTRTFVSIYMHLNRLYLVEATSPANYPAPSLFTESVNLLDEDGIQAWHEGVYINRARVDPFEKNVRVGRGQPQP